MAKKLFDAARVAASLSPAQVRAVQRGGISDESTETIRILADREMLFYREPTQMTTCYGFELTKFGKVVQGLLGRPA